MWSHLQLRREKLLGRTNVWGRVSFANGFANVCRPLSHWWDACRSNGAAPWCVGCGPWSAAALRPPWHVGQRRRCRQPAGARAQAMRRLTRASTITRRFTSMVTSTSTAGGPLRSPSLKRSMPSARRRRSRPRLSDVVLGHGEPEDLSLVPAVDDAAGLGYAASLSASSARSGRRGSGILAAHFGARSSRRPASERGPLRSARCPPRHESP